MISYHSYVKNAISFVYGNHGIYSLSSILEGVDTFSESDDIYIGHVNGTMSSSERKEVLTNFEKSNIGVVSNARCLTEGVDVPVIDAVYFADPKNSLVDIVQAVGRSLRKSTTKANEYSYIVIPMIIDKESSMFDEIDENNFKTMHSVIQAMRMQDKRLADEIDELNMHKAKGRYGKTDSFNSKIQIMNHDKLSIPDFEEGISLRIAEINKDISTGSKVKIDWTEKEARSSNIKRVFVSIGDYNLDTFKDNLVVPTLNKFIEDNIELKPKASSEIRINNNNISHTRRFGAIAEKEAGYAITELGEGLIENEYNNFYDYSKRQLLYYYSINKKNKQILFPYRTILKVLKETKQLTRLEFLYCLYPLRSTTDQDVEIAIENVLEIRKIYPNIEIMNETNKEKALDMLNSKLDVKFSFKDIWTSRTTTYNQFNYFKKHLQVFEDIIDSDTNKKNIISIKEGVRSKIDEILKNTDYIEQHKYNDHEEILTEYTTL